MSLLFMDIPSTCLLDYTLRALIWCTVNTGIDGHEVLMSHQRNIWSLDDTVLKPHTSIPLPMLSDIHYSRSSQSLDSSTGTLSRRFTAPLSWPLRIFPDKPTSHKSFAHRSGFNIPVMNLPCACHLPCAVAHDQINSYWTSQVQAVCTFANTLIPNASLW